MRPKYDPVSENPAVLGQAPSIIGANRTPVAVAQRVSLTHRGLGLTENFVRSNYQGKPLWQLVYSKSSAAATATRTRVMITARNLMTAS